MSDRRDRAQGSGLEVFLVFLRLGCISFGGPVAHLGYFQKELVDKRKWCDEVSFGEIVALSQSLPGPSSSVRAPGLKKRSLSRSSPSIFPLSLPRSGSELSSSPHHELPLRLR
jgi:hypothetical protein